MANSPQNAWQSYGVGWPLAFSGASSASAVGNKEVFLGEIAIIDPRETPTFDMLGKDEWAAPYQEWPVDSLGATATAPSIEAWEFQADQLSGRIRYNNVTQAFHMGLIVSRRQQQMSQRGVTQGVPNEYRYQLGKKQLDMNKNINARIVANGTGVASATGLVDTGSRTAALRGFPILVTNVSGAFSHSSYLNLHRKMDEVGVSPDTLLVSSGVKSDISQSVLGIAPSISVTATPSLRRFTQASNDRRYGGIIDILEDDFGQVQIVRDRWLPTASAVAAAHASTTGLTSPAACYFLFDKSYVKMGIFQAPVHKALPPNGDYERGFIVSEIAVKVLHPSAVAAGLNITQTVI